ncbi:uncharacterized protein N0V89_006846 [Didymosphaeria variabile]|uniref:Uncharacterized protein n=1 Tax=Didymosphaeria variabile TaxID=1932322 RepID=A0A9W9C9N7_9PLEO|nr:uncharacterized protein N0V89_006846 [Didymosphaeria variabile]KAJ4351503.1 hypothetical protein N0V89_006846 [Didymosphaeria variabile]
MTDLSLPRPGPVAISLLALVSVWAVVSSYKHKNDMHKHLAASERRHIAEKQALSVKLLTEKHELELKVLSVTHDLDQTKVDLAFEKSRREIQEKENAAHEALHRSAVQTVEMQEEQINNHEAFRQSAKQLVEIQTAKVRKHEATLEAAKDLMEAHQRRIRDLEGEVARLREGNEVTPPPAYHT